MAEKTFITVEATVSAPIQTVWDCWTMPEHVTQWNHASDDWHSPRGTADLKNGGAFTYRMEAKDGSVGFDFGGTYTNVVPPTLLESVMGDGRTISVNFEEQGGNTHVTETFQAENQNSMEMQRQGWQAILENFKMYAEAR